MREKKINRLGQWLLRTRFPKLEMSVMVAITGLAGFASSIVLFHAGLTSMGLRYPAAVAVAYLVLLLQLWLWLRLRDSATDTLDLMPDAVFEPAGGAGRYAPRYAGKGGSFDGGGASSDWEGGGKASVAEETVSFADAGDATIPLLAVAAVVALFCSLFYMAFSLVSSAPLLFAELLVDGAMSATLYKKLRIIDRRHWAGTALRRTVLPFALAAVSLGAAGFLMEYFAPNTHTLGAFVDNVARQP